MLRSKIGAAFINIENFIILSLYMVAYVPLLLNPGVYIDDWCMYNQKTATVITFFHELGFFAYWPAYLHNFVLSFPAGVLMERGIIVLSFLLSAFLLLSILKNIPEIDPISRFFIVIYFAVFPVNFGRIALSNIHYAICYFLFFAGIWLLSKYMNKKLIFLRLMSLIFLFFSLSTNSLLSYYGLVVLYILYEEKSGITSLKSFFTTGLRYADFIFVPMVYYVVKSVLFVPYGLYANVYPLSRKLILLSPLFTLIPLKQSFLFPMYWSLLKISSFVYLALVLAGIVLLYQFIKNEEYHKNEIRNNILLILLGGIIFYLGVFCYLAAGRFPHLFDWHSRHQLLIPLGAAFILYYGLKTIFDRLKLAFKIQLFVYSSLAIVFVFSNFMTYLDYQKDWLKQMSLVENMRSNKIVKENQCFLIIDNVKELNANRRFLRFYEYTGLMKVAFGDDSRFAELVENYTKMEDFRMYMSYPQYNMKTFKETEPQYKIIINPGTYQLTARRTIALIFREYFRKQQYKDMVKDIVSLECVKI